MPERMGIWRGYAYNAVTTTSPLYFYVQEHPIVAFSTLPGS